MLDATPVLLIASVSAWEAQRLELSLRSTGCEQLRVEKAEEAARLLDRRRERGAVLIIDAGLLEMPHDPQWRSLREGHPELGTIVRCLRPRPRDARTLEVHPDDVDGIREAVRRPARPSWPELAPRAGGTLAKETLA